jgi:DNA repair protein RecN (Recombination protein N)
MLAEFHLQNFVLIESGTLRFGPGLNILSGETGAGKSLVATALSVALGQSRFETRHIRSGAESATLTAVFELPVRRLRALGAELELDLAAAEEEGLILERTARREGRSRIAVGGRPVPLATLRELGRRLVDIAAQDEHTLLRDPAAQREILDRYGGLEEERAAVAAAYRRLNEIRERLEGGEALRRRRREELELVRHQRRELEAVGPDPEADAGIDERVAFLQNAAELRSFCTEAVEELYESDRAVADRLGSVEARARELAGCAPDLGEAAAQLESARVSLEEAVRLLRETEAATDVDEDELERTVERLHALQDLARRHEVELSELDDVLQRLAAREAELAGWQEEAANLEPELAAAADGYRTAAEALRRARRAAADRLTREVKKHLQGLGMGQAGFRIDLAPLAAGLDAPAELARAATAAGLDAVEFQLRPNPGEEWGTLAETASGGETTRAMLALKSAAGRAQPCEVLFFDEIDAGVGGRLGEPIAEHLEGLAAQRQVIAITHLPQIASHGAVHLCVRKETAKGRTRTTFGAVRGADRVAEIAGMIRGARSTETTLAQAREMLGEAAEG